MKGVSFHDDGRPPDTTGLALQFMGTAGFRIVAQGTHFWLDPHFSRHSLKELLFSRIAPDAAKVLREVDVAHGIAVGHSHFDHALDTPVIAKAHGAHVYGSSDTLHWCRSYGVDEGLLHELKGEGETFQEGAFAIQAFKSVHSPFLLGKVPFPGRITGPIPTPAKMSAWRVGQVFGLRMQCAAGSVFHLGSAGLVDAELAGVRADVALLCTIGRHATPRFVERALDLLQPKLVVPCHWDRFWRPIDEPPREIPGNDLAGFVAEVRAHACKPEVKVAGVRGWVRIA